MDMTWTLILANSEQNKIEGRGEAVGGLENDLKSLWRMLCFLGLILTGAVRKATLPDGKGRERHPVSVSQHLTSQLAQGESSPGQKPCSFPVGTPGPTQFDIRLPLRSALAQLV